MKKRLIDAGILVAVFIVAVIVFSYITNRGRDNMTADLGTPTLPRVYFSYDGYGVNPLIGYVKDMDVTAMRETITPVKNRMLDINIEAYDNKIDRIEYQLYTLNGKEKLAEESLGKIEEKIAFQLPENVLTEERILVVKLHMKKKTVNYYTRVTDAGAYNVESCLDYVTSFHESALAKVEGAGVGAAIEPTEKGDNTTLQHVTINSDYEHVTWGGLKPTLVGVPKTSIVETNSTSTSVLMEYKVRCAGEENEEDIYNVKEFFRVRNLEGTMYLLNYDREMEQIFEGAKNVLNEKGILLGIATYDLPYLVNDNGTIVSFVQADELWNYNRDRDELSLLFSFKDAENTDVRNLTARHKVKLLSVDKTGNTTFAVYGYMNRGEHEGQVGVSIYYYDIEKNSIDEKVFIDSDKSADIAMDELGRLVYFSIEREMLYVLADGSLYEVNIKKDDQTELVKELEEGQYVVSEDGHLVAYQSNGKIDEASEVIVKNLNTGEQHSVAAKDDECMKPLGFINNDFVYGIAKKEDVGTTVSGEAVIPMYKVEIMDSKKEVIKTYDAEQNYILDTLIEGGMITLSRAVKSGDTYTSIAADYIKNNEKKEESNIFLESYVTEKKETQMRLTFEDGIRDKKPKVLKPKQVFFENPVTISFGSSNLKNKFYVYGYGELQGVYKNAGYAVQKANDISGVVVDSNQKYVWERGNRYLQYTLTGKDEVISKLLDQLQAGVSPIEAVSEVSGKRGLSLTGCVTEEMLYIVNRGTPVVGMIDGRASVILIGYDETAVYYIDTQSRQQLAVSYAQMDEMLSGTGRAFIGYVE